MRTKWTAWALLSVAFALAACDSRQGIALSPAPTLLRGSVVYLDPAVEAVGSEADDFKDDKGDAKLRQAVREALIGAGYAVVDSKFEPHALSLRVQASVEGCCNAQGLTGWVGLAAYEQNRILHTVRFRSAGATDQSVPEAPKDVQVASGWGYGGSRIPLDAGPWTIGRLLVNTLFESEQVVAHVTRGRGPAVAAAASEGNSMAAPTAAAPAAATAQAPTRPAAPALPNPQWLAGAPQRNAIALVVGIESYRDAPAAPGARADAVALAELARRTLGIPESNVHVVVDDRATKGDIEKQLAWVKTNAPPGGTAFFFFSGHGAPDASKGTPYLVPYDGDPRALDQTALPLTSVIRALSDSRAKDIIAFTDACFSGAGGRSVLPPGARPLVRVREAEPGSARVGLFSASSGAEISGPTADGRGGLFSHWLAQGIGRGQADIDGDGTISLQELRQWVTPRVAREAKRDNRDQTPSLVLGKGLDPDTTVIAHGVAKD